MKPDIVILVLVLAVIVFLFSFPFQKKIASVEIGGVKVKAEVADNPITQTKGLMFHKPLAEDDGMLFKFGREGQYTFWMMNVSFPIDIIWINSEKKVVHIVEHAEPCFLNCKLYASTAKAKYVLEVKAGFVKKHKIEIGSKVSF